jgi:hypothetical protein
MVASNGSVQPSSWAGQQADVVVELGVFRAELLDPAHGVDHRGVIAPAEAAADLGKRARGELLGQVHRDLARTRDLAARRALVISALRMR